jgi:DNA-directed RNA polymerase subunit RPC12/RpoP
LERRGAPPTNIEGDETVGLVTLHFTCYRCKQSFTATGNYLVNKEHLECPNCSNPVSAELFQILVALCRRWPDPKTYGGFPEDRWDIKVEGTVI